MNNTVEEQKYKDFYCMNIKEAADYLKCSTKFIRDRIKEKSLSYIKLNGMYRFSVFDLENYAFSNSSDSIPEHKNTTIKEKHLIYDIENNIIEKEFRTLPDIGPYQKFCVNEILSLERNPFFSKLNGKLV